METPKFLIGKRTYLIMAVTIILGVIDSWNQYCTGVDVVSFCRQIEIPGIVFSALAGLGIYTRKLANK